MSFSAKKYCSVREKGSDFVKIPFEEKPPPVFTGGGQNFDLRGSGEVQAEIGRSPGIGTDRTEHGEGRWAGQAESPLRFS